MDYEQGLKQLRQILHGTARESELRVYEARLQENLHNERLYGSNEQVRSDRSRIIDQLNRLAGQVNADFNDLCLNLQISSSAPSPDPTQAKASNSETPSATSSSNPERTKVFISYSRIDKQFLNRLKKHLEPDIRNKLIEEFDDTGIKAGEFWRTKIDQALQSTKVAVLLVSADFLASKFITIDELPPLLDAANSGAVTILPVLVKPCRYKPLLKEIQFVHDTATSLMEMEEAQQERIWIQVADRITEILSSI